MTVDRYRTYAGNTIIIKIKKLKKKKGAVTYKVILSIHFPVYNQAVSVYEPVNIIKTHSHNITLFVMRFDALYVREFLFLVQNISSITDQCVMYTTNTDQLDGKKNKIF